MICLEIVASVAASILENGVVMMGGAGGTMAVIATILFAIKKVVFQLTTADHAVAGMAIVRADRVSLM